MNLKQLLVLAAFALSWPAYAQEEPQDTVISVDVQVVNVLATVRDNDGVLQDIKYFTRQADLPLTIGLLVDTSVSQENLIYEERTAGYRFFDKVLRIDEDLAFLMSFDIDVELLQDLTAAKPLLQDGLERLEVQGSTRGVTAGPVPQNSKPVGTAMFDGIYLAANEMLKGQAGRKALVLVTDGYDYGSKVKIEEAIEASQRSDVIIFSVRYYDTRFYQGGAVIGGGRSDLRQLSRSTGGDTYEVKRKQTLDQIFEDINNVVRNQYAIGYSPKRDLSDKGFRKIELKLKNKRLEAQTRAGYYPSEL
jgi:VWFA-related protein